MRFLRENFTLKVLSLALAIGVWFYVRGEEKPVQIVSVPLELQNLPPDLAIAGDVLESVNVRVRAPEGILKQITPEKFLARVDLAPLAAGDQMVRIRPESIRIPPGAEVVRVSPEYMPLRLEKKIQRDLPAKARIAGEPAAGYVVGESAVEPVQVTVEGPESAVRQAREVQTDIVRVDGRSTPFEVIVGLTPDRSGVKVSGEALAVMKVDIHVRYVTRVLSGVKVMVEGADLPVRLSPLTIEVTVEGPPGALADLTEESVAAVVDVAPLAPRAGEYRVKPRIVFKPESLAERVTVRHVSAEEIAVHVLRRRRR